MKRIIAMIFVFALILQVLPAVADFSDLSNHWSKNYVRFLEREGIVSGKTSDTFDPEGTITRAEFVSLVVRLANLPEGEPSPYADVREGWWFTTSVSAAKAFDALDDALVSDGSFYPDRPITREEMTSIIVRMSERICGAILNVRTDFTDADTFSECYADYIAKAAGEGIVTGNPDGTFNPRGNATRAEATVVIKRFYDLLHRAPRRLEAGEYHPVYDGIIYEVDLQSMITDAYQKGERSITLEKGVYRLKPHHNDGHLNFTDMQDFTVYGNGSTLLYQSPGAAGVVFKNSENIHLMNLNTDCELLTCEQGRITAINTEDFYIEFVVPNGYRDYFENKSGFADEANLEIRDGQTGDYMGRSTIFFSKLEQLGNRRYRLHSATIAQTRGMKIGDYVVLGSRTVPGASVYFFDSKQCALTDYTIWSGSVGLYMEGGYGDHRIENVHLEPGPRPLGATVDRVFSTVADAAHIRLLEVGPKIRNSTFTHMGDDGFNCYGRFYRVAEQTSANEIILAAKSGVKYLKAGDRIRFYHADGSFAGESKVASITDEADYTCRVNLNVSFDANDFKANSFHRIKLAAPLKGLLPTDWVTNPSRNCVGFEIVNNTYGKVRSRGILVKGSDGLIEGNTIFNSGSSAILLAPEFNWLEADFVRNVTVRNNTLINNGSSNRGAIYVHSMFGRENQNIVIEDNTIIDCAYEAMKLTCIKGLIVRNNTIVSRHPDNAKNVAAILIDKVDGAEIYGNTFPDGWDEIRVTEDTSDILLK